MAANGCVTRRSLEPLGDPLSPETMTDGGASFGAFLVDDGGPGPSGGGCPAQAPVPDFGTPVTCGAPPPPISGGTLLVTRDGTKAIAADSDRDAVYVIDLASRTRLFTVSLQAGDEPGRLAEDGAGRIHVALRGRAALATLDPASGTVTARRAACPAPRGVAWQASNDTVWVACATGELAALPAAGGAASIQVIQRDLRDVLVNGDALAVTQFRSARLLRLAGDGTIARIDPMPSAPGLLASHVAWRAVSGPNGSVVAVHQAESTQSISTRASGGYGCGGLGGPPIPLSSPAPGFEDSSLASDDGSASEDSGLASNNGSGPEDSGLASNDGALDPRIVPGIQGGLGSGPVTSVLTVVASDGTATLTQRFNGVLPVDVAVSPDGSTGAVVTAGSGAGDAAVDNVYLFALGNMGIFRSLNVGPGQATAVAFEPNGDLVLQTREPAALWIVPGVAGASDAGATDGAALSIPLSSISKRDTGHDIFHTHAGALVACASCHPEGGDDGHVWILDGASRRTPSLRGTIAGTAPYHWPGDEADFAAIVSEVYVVRMGGSKLSTGQTAALSTWVNAIPAPPAPTWVDASAAAAGRTIFERADVGCATCHYGSKFTNNATVDVGTGGAFQVPPLVGVGWRTPLLHSGCAATIADRFGSCATKAHGNIASLSAADIANLTAYLETL